LVLQDIYTLMEQSKKDKSTKSILRWQGKWRRFLIWTKWNTCWIPTDVIVWTWTRKNCKETVNTMKIMARWICSSYFMALLLMTST
jgi:hypothetical protein